jgi:uncharacterized protein YjbI with pentapeptide repeats
MPHDEPGNFPPDDDSPRRAVVVPRAKEGENSSSLPIERLILPYLREKARGVISIAAPPGGGKTTALRHLRAVFSEYPLIRFFDGNQPQYATKAGESELVASTCESTEPKKQVLARFELCPWTIDDCMEYLAALHRDQLPSVLKRLSEDPSLEMLKGSPELLTLVMDQMAGDTSLTTAREALRRFVAERFLHSAQRDTLMVVCCRRVGILNLDIDPKLLARSQPTMEQKRWFRHEAIQKVLVGEWIADDLVGGRISSCLRNMVSKEELAEIAASVACREVAIEKLDELVTDDPTHSAVPMAASILLRINPAWRPTGGAWPLNLDGAVLRSAQWATMNLDSAKLSCADFTDADLSGANLSQAKADFLRMTRANLRQTRFDKANLGWARFDGADLTQAVFEKTNLSFADFAGANLTSANLTRAGLKEANLEGAILHGAILRKALLVRVNVEDADFTNADLTFAKLESVQMWQAKWNSALFVLARLHLCNLEGLELEGADFTRARLAGSLFTGSRIRKGKFVGANLSQTGLAEIEWEGADLRDADLTYASFHLGSSRSGLVGSTIPCEGSRTGFYTDDYYEQDYKSPEEIRKACLCGADLRGAKVEKTDFYLVDLRGAKYNDGQEKHFASCGAILVSRVV